MEDLKELEIGKTYTFTFIGDSDSCVPCKVISRTAKFVTIKVRNDDAVKVKVHVFDNVEHCYPLGKYSMAPLLGADRELIEKTPEEESKNLYDLAYRAFSGTSFSPERRAKDTVEWIEEQLEHDLKKIWQSGSIGKYKEKYMAHVNKWLNAKSRCMSWMITGPAKFPVARNQKNLGYEESAYKNWMEWRAKYIKAVFRVPTPSPEESLDEALKDYDKAMQKQGRMKAVNKILKSKTKNRDQKYKELSEHGLSSMQMQLLSEKDDFGNIGFASFKLTNNNSKIKRLEQKVLTMRARISRKEEFEPIEFEGGSIDIQNDRVVIFHDEKPEQEVIINLKSRGFRWSRNYSCWCRKHTANALYVAKQIVGIK